MGTEGPCWRVWPGSVYKTFLIVLKVFCYNNDDFWLKLPCICDTFLLGVWCRIHMGHGSWVLTLFLPTTCTVLAGELLAPTQFSQPIDFNGRYVFKYLHCDSPLVIAAPGGPSSGTPCDRLVVGGPVVRRAIIFTEETVTIISSNLQLLHQKINRERIN